VYSQRDVIEQAGNSALTPKARPKPPLRRVRSYLAAKRVTANRERTVAFDEERLAIVKDRLGDVLLQPSRARRLKASRRSGSSMESATARSTWTWVRCARS
jgi:hypothetical protein